MARRIGPDEGSRKVETMDPTTKVVKGKPNRPVQVFVDEALTIPADILTFAGQDIADSTVTTDAYSYQPLYQFPDGEPFGPDTLYVTCDGGPAWPVYARTDDRLDAVEAVVAGLGNAATRNVGTTAGTVAAGDDGRIAGAVQASLVDAKGDLLVGTAGDTVMRLPVGADGQALRADPAASSGIAWRPSDPNAYTSGVATMDRFVAVTTLAVTTQSLRLVYFTAPRAETWTTIAATTGGTAAGATPTLCRMGIYSVDGAGNLTLVGACANDTTLFAGNNTRYTRSLTANITAVAGQRYAHALLIVSSFTMPTFAGAGSNVAFTALAPRIAASVSGQSDLPASVAVGSLGVASATQFGEVF